ncbi:hypothetical protein OIA45_19635 [Streptomyces chartreusis]|uniref:hypothetical protein n=1 Tax=Streptomyces chartreusis TaxID=1969 RepID=UPI0038633253|nr:hypothetical protein OIA45_19635 [Streptomyces chartreusis]
MHTRWYQQLWAFLRTREGLGTLLIAAFSAIALGVVPNMLEKLWDSGWFYLVVFLMAIVIVVLGWVLRRERGVGVVIPLFPQALTQTSRLAEMRRASEKNHSSTLSIHPRLLRPGDKTLSPLDRADLVANLIDARVDEYRSSGAEGAVTLYPLAQMRDGFLLGRRLFKDHHTSLTVMHSSRDNDKTVVPGVILGSHLTQLLTAEEQAIVTAILELAPGRPHPLPVAHPACPAEHRHRLAFIVRLTPVAGMVDDARYVAQTGNVRRPTDQTHTGYVFDEANVEATGTPCGAHVAIEASVSQLPETREVFEAIATYLRQAWTTAKDAWQAECGSASIDTRLFITAPLPITIAFGWLTANENMGIVHHNSRLLNTTAPTGATP